MTAVQWLQEALSLTFKQEMQFEGLFQQAMEMEKEQQDDFAIGFAKWVQYHSELWIKYTTKELLEIYKKEKGQEVKQESFNLKRGLKELQLKDPNTCENYKEVGCVKDVCDCYTLVSKEETLEEFIIREGYPIGSQQEIWEDGVRNGAKWQQEQDKNKYSEKDMRKAYSIGWITRERFDDLSPDIIYPKGLDYEEKRDYAFNLWFEQFKKK